MKLDDFLVYTFQWQFDSLTYDEKRRKEEPYDFILRGQGLVHNGKKFETALLKVVGFNPYIYIDLPNRDTKGRGIQWNKTKISAVKHYIHQKLKYKYLMDIEYEKRKTTRAYSNSHKNLLKLSFSTQDVIRDIQHMFRTKGKSKFSNLSIQKCDKEDLLDLLDLLPEDDHGIVYSIIQDCKDGVLIGEQEDLLEKAVELQNIISCLKKKEEIYINEHHISEVSNNPIKLEIYEDWVDAITKYMSVTGNSPTGWKRVLGTAISDEQKDSNCKYEIEVDWNKMASFHSPNVVCPTICSLDIETFSSRYKQASSGVSAAPDPYRVDDDVWMAGLRFNRFRSNKQKSYILTTRNCNPKKHKNSKVIKCKEEAELLMKIRDIIIKEDPDILLGHNILGYDLQYLAKRAGYNDGVKPTTEYEKRQKALTLEKNAIWSEFAQLGRLKDHPSRYVKNSWSSGAYSGMNFEYMDIDGRLLIDTFPYCKRSYPGLESHKLDFLAKKYLGENKVDVGYYEMWEIADRNIAEEVDRVIEYQEQDTMLPLKLFNKLNIWIDLTEISKVVNLPIFELYTRGQSKRGLAQIYKKCNTRISEDADLYVLDLPEPEHKDDDEDDEKYQGAYVHTPTPGVYRNVLCLDFASLYPSMIRAYNLDYTTFVDDPDIPDEMCHIIEWTDNKTGIHYRFRFIKQEYHRGILPMILDEFTDARAQANAEKKQHKHPEADMALVGHEVEYATLDSRQKELKVSSNSAYGLMGFRKGRLGNMPAAMCTTAKGRQSIEKVMDYLKEKYGAEIVYGDTDSAMFRVPSWDYTQSYDNGPKIAAEISAEFPKPMKLEFEKIFYIFVILKKKMYAGLIYNRDRSKLIMFMKKGLITQRRDYCKYIKDIYNKLLEMTLDENSNYEEMLSFIIDKTLKLVSRQVSMEELTRQQTYKPPYKVKLAHAVLAEKMKKQGVDVQPGDKIHYVYVETEGAKKVSDRVQDPTLCKKFGQKLDVIFYIESQMTSRLVDLLDAIYPKIKVPIKRMKHAYDRNGNKVKPLSHEGIPYVKGEDTITVHGNCEKLMKALMDTAWKKQIVNTHLNKIFKKTEMTNWVDA